MSNFSHYHQLLIRNVSTRNLIFPPQFIRLFFPFTTIPNQNPPPQNSFMAIYLVNSFGFSMNKAIALSSNLNHLSNPKKPDSVLKFFKNHNFNDTQIRNMINRRPTILSSNIEKTIEPKIMVFKNLGISDTDLANLIASNPNVLDASLVNHYLPTIDFLRNILHSDEKVITVLKKSAWLLFFDIQRIMLPNVAFLRSCGVSDHWISKLVLKNPRLITQKPGWLEDIVERVEGLGIRRDSGMFVHAFIAISNLSKSTLEAKFGIFRSFGWSETNIITAIHRAPYVVMFSECKIRRVMDFLNEKLGYDPSYAAFHAYLFMYSLEKRLIPRYNVLEILKSKSLIQKSPNFPSMAVMPEKKFIEGYVLCYMNEVPEIHEAYMASQGNALSTS